MKRFYRIGFSIEVTGNTTKDFLLILMKVLEVVMSNEHISDINLEEMEGD